MTKRAKEANGSQAAETGIKSVLGLDDMIQQGARKIIQQAIIANSDLKIAFFHFAFPRRPKR